MIQLVSQPSGNTVLAVWNIEESEMELAKEVSKTDLEKIKGYHPKKRQEFLATRQLMSAMCKQEGIQYDGIRKDEFGKPHLIDSPFHISVSHAYPMVACMINKTAPCGIDIEKPRPQLNRIKKKFLNDIELERCGDDLDLLCLHWCAKEALYKIYGRKQLIFGEELFIRSIGDGILDCEVITHDYQQKHTLKFIRHGGFFVVMNI